MRAAHLRNWAARVESVGWMVQKGGKEYEGGKANVVEECGEESVVIVEVVIEWIFNVLLEVRRSRCPAIFVASNLTDKGYLPSA